VARAGDFASATLHAQAVPERAADPSLNKVEKMAKRNGNRELKKPKQLREKSTGVNSVAELAARRGPTLGGRK
jgi:hypothetical protein